jgi:hypothetical protein
MGAVISILIIFPRLPLSIFFVSQNERQSLRRPRRRFEIVEAFTVNAGSGQYNYSAAGA